MSVDEGLRAERRRRVFTQMERAGVDALLLAREGNIRYVTGAHRLWLAGMRQWAPSCVVVRQTEAVHLLSITDDGLPPEIPADRLYPITWNPMNLLGAIATMDGMADAGTIAVDGSTPMMRDLLAGVLPGAVVSDGGAVMADVRRIKIEAELGCIREAVDVARAATAAGAERAESGSDLAEIEGGVRRRAAELGSTAVSAPVEVTPWSIQASVLLDGYEGAAGWVSPALADRVEAVRRGLRDRCRAGRPLSELRDAYEATGEALPPGVIARGTGVGAEPPVLRAERAQEARLEAGMVVLVRSAVSHEDEWPGAIDVVVITENGPETLAG